MSGRYDVIVVGSGPGGATVTRELARAGKRVLLLEKGKEHKNLGTYRSALAIFDRFGFFKSKEGLIMLKATTLGGASMVYSGSAAMPPPWLKSRYGIDLEGYSDAICRELKVDILPERFLGEASRSIMEAGNRIGQQWEPMPKFLDVSKFRNGESSGALASLGLNYGERWTAREFINQAIEAGAEVITRAECLEVIVEDGVAAGVRARVSGSEVVDYFADKVVLCAGGIPTPVLLKKAGIEAAGQGCVVDPTVLVYGISPRVGSYKDPLVSVVSWKWYDSDGIRVGTLIDPWLLTLIGLAKAGVRHIPKILKYKKMIGILIKVKDELGGWVNVKGEVSKALTDADMAKMNKGISIAKEVLIEAGCSPADIVTGEIRGAHPSGTCRIGEVVDSNLKTSIENLYVCDASVFPEALDRPTVVTIIAFGMRLVDHLLGTRPRAENDGTAR
jgi:choline dehydrogenase-like flavoprotein